MSHKLPYRNNWFIIYTLFLQVRGVEKDSVSINEVVHNIIWIYHTAAIVLFCLVIVQRSLTLLIVCRCGNQHSPRVV